MKDIIQLNKIFKKISFEVMDKYPYRFNPLEEASFDENAQSRILGRLMRYNKNGTYLFLENLLSHLNKRKGLSFPKEVSSLDITIEKYRIDILIQGKKDFVIIFENKFYDAVDQDEQIDRYIDKCVNYLNFNIENVFVIYLTPNKSEIPKSSLSDKNRERLKGRIAEISVKNDLLKVLDQFKLDIPKKENFLISGIEQYVDYLKSTLDLNKQVETMDKEIITKIENHLYNNDVDENLSTLDKLERIGEYQEEISQLKNTIDELYLEKRKVLISYWATQLSKNESVKDFYLSEKSNVDENTGFKYIELVPKKNPHNISYRIEDNIGSIYYGIYIQEVEKSVDIQIKLSELDFNTEKTEHPEWYLWKYIRDTDYSNAVEDLISLAKDVQKIMNSKVT